MKIVFKLLKNEIDFNFLNMILYYLFDWSEVIY